MEHERRRRFPAALVRLRARALGRRTRWLAIVSLLGLFSVAWWSACSPVRAYEVALVLADTAAGEGPSRLKATTRAPVREFVAYRVDGRARTADVYRPGGGRARAGLVLVPAFRSSYDAQTLCLEGSLAPLRDRPTWTRTLAGLRRTDWVVYAKRPFAGPHQVLDYVGRYTHRVAIANHRLLDIEHGQVRFTYKDYRATAGYSQKTMTLAAREFIRRFLLHVLPAGFHRRPLLRLPGRPPSPRQAGPLPTTPWLSDLRAGPPPSVHSARLS